MKANINRPQQCPHYLLGVRYELCLYPSAPAPLRCDYSASAVAEDGFPKDCPLRRVSND